MLGTIEASTSRSLADSHVHERERRLVTLASVDQDGNVAKYEAWRYSRSGEIADFLYAARDEPCGDRPRGRGGRRCHPGLEQRADLPSVADPFPLGGLHEAAAGSTAG